MILWRRDLQSDYISPDFFRLGYQKFRVHDVDNLSLFRSEVLRIFQESLVDIGVDGNSLKRLDDLHKVLTGNDINNYRLRCIEKLNAMELINNRLLLDPLPGVVTSLIGHDQLIQRNVNLVVQRPLDIDNSELHRDYPGNSEFEIVIWIPMVDCPSDMSMYVLDFTNSVDVARRIKSSPEAGWSALHETVKNHAVFVPVDFGEALVFMTPLFHGSDINKNERTRVSFNFRLRGLFHPSGLRDAYAFWRLLNVSEFTKKMLQGFND